MLNILSIAYLHDKLKLSANYTKSSKPVVGHKVILKESGCARDILPLCTKTVIHISGNLRDLLSLLNVRCDAHSQLRDIRIDGNC